MNIDNKNILPLMYNMFGFTTISGMYDDSLMWLVPTRICQKYLSGYLSLPEYMYLIVTSNMMKPPLSVIKYKILAVNKYCVF